MSEDEIDTWQAALIVETVDGRKYYLTPPRPDYRWVPGEGRRRHEPERMPTKLPAPPKVCVMVPGDIAWSVKEYAQGLDRWYDQTERRLEE